MTVNVRLTFVDNNMTVEIHFARNNTSLVSSIYNRAIWHLLLLSVAFYISQVLWIVMLHIIYHPTIILIELLAAVPALSQISYY